MRDCQAQNLGHFLKGGARDLTRTEGLVPNSSQERALSFVRHILEIIENTMFFPEFNSYNLTSLVLDAGMGVGLM